jgi:hypothetical protein
METFFAQVEDLILARQGDDDAIVGWVGTSYREVLHPDAFSTQSSWQFQ